MFQRVRAPGTTHRPWTPYSLAAAAGSVIARGVRHRRAARRRSTAGRGGGIEAGRDGPSSRSELRRRPDVLWQIVENSPALVFLRDADGRFGFVNREYVRVFGTTPEDVEGRTLEEVFASDVAAALRGSDAAVLRAREPMTLEERVPGEDGDRTYLATKFPVFDASGRPYAVGGVATDISARKEVERLKEEFVSLVGHELRTPLTSLRTALAVVASRLPEDAERPRRMLDVAIDSAERLGRLVEDILDTERLKSGRLPLATREVAAADLVAEAVEMMTGVAEQAGIRLVPRGALGRVVADAERVHQALTNLITNAIKFSPSGSTVEIGAEPLGAEVVFAVRDEGRGIPANKLAAVFERFEQVEPSDAVELGGVGLGLAICRAIVQRHGGRIWVDSEPGVGSTFSFTLPSAEAPASGDRVAAMRRRGPDPAAPPRAGAHRPSP